MSKYTITDENLNNPFYRDRNIGDHLFITTSKMKAEAIRLAKYIEFLKNTAVNSLIEKNEFDYFEIVFIIGCGKNISHQAPVDIIYSMKHCYDDKKVCKLLIQIDLHEITKHEYRCGDFEEISTKKTELGKETISILEPEYFIECGNFLIITKQFNTFMPNICDKDLPFYRTKLEMYAATSADIKFVSDFIGTYRELVDKLFENKTKFQIITVNYAVFLNIYVKELASRYITYPIIPLNFGAGYEMFDYLLIGLKDKYRSEFYKIYTWGRPNDNQHELYHITNKSSLLKI